MKGMAPATPASVRGPWVKVMTKKKSTRRGHARKMTDSPSDGPTDSFVQPTFASRNELATALGELAAVAELSPEVSEAQAVARILRVLAADLRDGKMRENEHSEWKERRAGEWIGSLEGQVKHKLQTWQHMGPILRPKEAAMLRSRLQNELRNKRGSESMAKALLRTLRACPLICADTAVPAIGAWAQTDRDEKTAVVERALARTIDSAERIDEEALVRAALKALGYPKTKLRGLFDPDRKKVERSAQG